MRKYNKNDDACPSKEITVIGRYRCAGTGFIIHIFYDSKKENAGSSISLKERHLGKARGGLRPLQESEQ